jgi:multidrug efflux pump subunit AcrA (membrane-fusion protein)
MLKSTDRTRAGQILWNAAIVVALVAVVLLYINNRQLAANLAAADQHNQEQIAKLQQDLVQTSAATAKSVDDFARQVQDATAQTDARAKQDLRKASATLSAALAKQQQDAEQARQQLTGQLTDLQQANTTAAAKIGEISENVSGVKTEVASTQTELEKTGNDLKRVMGDMGVMSGLIATNSTQLNALKELGDRDYIEFDLKKVGGKQKVGDMQLTLAKADPKHNRFTLQVLADYKMMEKRDRTINEPVQLYLAGNRQPEEIVVNEVKKDEVVGYISIPKVKMARR